MLEAPGLKTGTSSTSQFLQFSEGNLEPNISVIGILVTLATFPPIVISSHENQIQSGIVCKSYDGVMNNCSLYSAGRLLMKS